MADPFEIRMRFTKQLQHLNASTNAAQKCAQYALKHKSVDEDLHSCILEQLEQSRNMNVRANIMYFIEHFIPLARKDGHMNYIRMIQRDIIRIVDAVAPDDGTGAANIKVVRKVLGALNTKGYILTETLKDIEAALDDREVKDFVLTSPAIEQDDQTAYTAREASGASGATRNGGRRLDTRQIEQRIEEDRERHKRQRETMWAVLAGGPDDAFESAKAWDETSDYGSDDDRLAGEEMVDRKKQWGFECEHGTTGEDMEMRDV